MLSLCIHVQLFATLWTVAHQAPLSMGFSRQEYWSRVSCPPLGDLPVPGIEPASLMSPALADRFLTASATWEALPLSIFENNLCSNMILMKLLRNFLCRLKNWLQKVKSRPQRKKRGFFLIPSHKHKRPIILRNAQLLSLKLMHSLTHWTPEKKWYYGECNVSGNFLPL